MVRVRRTYDCYWFGVVASAPLLAGCVTTSDYSVSVGEPTNGTVIQNLTVTDINELDGAQYKLEYSLNSSYNGNYTVNTYEQTNGSSEFVSTAGLTGHEPTHKNDLPLPWNPGEKRTYRIDIVRGETVIDSITVELKRTED